MPQEWESTSDAMNYQMRNTARHRPAFKPDTQAGALHFFLLGKLRGLKDTRLLLTEVPLTTMIHQGRTI